MADPVAMKEFKPFKQLPHHLLGHVFYKEYKIWKLFYLIRVLSHWQCLRFSELRCIP